MAKNSDSKIWAFLGVFLTLLGFLIVYFGKKDDKYAMYYAKQGLVIAIAYFVIWIIAFIPFIGGIVAFVANIGLLILWIIGIIYSLSGEQKDIPILGEFAKKINL